MYKKIIAATFCFLLLGIMFNMGTTTNAKESGSENSLKNNELNDDIYIIEFKTTDKNKNKEKILKKKGKIRTVYKNFNFISAQLSEEDVKKLKLDKDIKGVGKNKKGKMIPDDHGNEEIVPPLAAPREANWGYNAIKVDETYSGEGVKIGIMDSGIKEHEEFWKGCKNCSFGYRCRYEIRWYLP